MSLIPYKVTALKRLDTTGLNIIPLATVSVVSGVSYAQLWEEEAGTTPVANPLTCDNNGEREFWILPGEYLISVSGGQSWNVSIRGQSDVFTVDNISVLREARTIENGQKISVTSYNSGWAASLKPPVGGGMFTYVATDTSSAEDYGHIIVGTDGKRYYRDSVDCVNVQHFGAIGNYTNEFTALNRARAKWYALNATTDGAQYPPLQGRDLYFPSGVYTANAEFVIETPGTGATIRGDGLSSVLDRIIIQVTRYRCDVKDMMLIGNTSVGIDVRDSPTVGDVALRFGKISRVHIRDKTSYGIRVKGDNSHFMMTDVHLEKNGTGLRIDQTLGIQLTNINIMSSTNHGIHLNKIIGGEVKLCNVTSLNSGDCAMYMYGDGTQSLVECYFEMCTFSGSGGLPDSFAITGCADVGGGLVEFTTSSDHTFIDGCYVTITGTTSYNVTNVAVQTVPTKRKFTIVATFTTSQTGTARNRGWDLLIENGGTLTDGDVNDMFFMGGNFNAIKILGGYNIEFMGTRIKDQIYVNNSCRVSRFGSARGRNLNITQKDIPVSGEPTGFCEVVCVQKPGGTFASGTSGIEIRVPSKADTTGINQPNRYNRLQLYEDSLILEAEGKSVAIDTNGINITAIRSGVATMADDTAISITPPSVYGEVIITNSQGQQSRRAHICYRADGTLPVAASTGAVGSFVGLTTGVLTGTTFTDTFLNISTHTDGKIYIENRLGATRDISWTFIR